jgi:hypothetical protein
MGLVPKWEKQKRRIKMLVLDGNNKLNGKLKIKLC